MPVPTKPRFRGKVTYANGQPAKNIKISIYDVDNDLLNGNANQYLTTVTTNAQGRFSKRASRSWKNNNLDVPIFVMKLKDEATDNSLPLGSPFPYAGDNVYSPIVLPWNPPTSSGGSNGGPFILPSLTPVTVIDTLFQNIPTLTINSRNFGTQDDAEDVYEYLKDLVEDAQSISIRFSGPLADIPAVPMLPNGKLDYDALRGIVCDKLGLDTASSILTINPALETLSSVCIIFIIFVMSPIAVAGATAGLIFTAALAIAVLLAVHYGYRVEVRRNDNSSSQVDPLPGVPIPLSNLELLLIPPDNQAPDSPA